MSRRPRQCERCGKLFQARPRETVCSGCADDDSGDDEAPSGDETKECPRCAETIKARAKVCRFCGTDVDRPGRAPSSVRPNARVRALAQGVGLRWGRAGFALVVVALVVVGAQSYTRRQGPGDRELAPRQGPGDRELVESLQQAFREIRRDVEPDPMGYGGPSLDQHLARVKENERKVEAALAALAPLADRAHASLEVAATTRNAAIALVGGDWPLNGGIWQVWRYSVKSKPELTAGQRVVLGHMLDRFEANLLEFRDRMNAHAARLGEAAAEQRTGR